VLDQEQKIGERGETRSLVWLAPWSLKRLEGGEKGEKNAGGVGMLQSPRRKPREPTKAGQGKRKPKEGAGKALSRSGSEN